MDADRFDFLSRSLADRVSRRSALKNVGGGGLLAATLAGFGLSRSNVSAQTDNATCVLDLVAGFRIGPTFDNRPNQDQVFEAQGQLRFAIGEQGRLVDGTFQLGGNEYPAVGQVAGPAVTIRIAVAPEQTLVLVGAGENALRSCTGDVDGMMTGPLVGDLGDWHAVAATSDGPQGDETPTAGGQATETPGVVTVASTATVPPASTQAPTAVGTTSTQAPSPTAGGGVTQTPTLEPIAPGPGDENPCGGWGARCSSSSDCCLGYCNSNGTCDCQEQGACTSHNECCGYCNLQSGFCTCVASGGVCAPINNVNVGGCCSGSCRPDNYCA
jgi:hypothetical protein